MSIELDALFATPQSFLANWIITAGSTSIKAACCRLFNHGLFVNGTNSQSVVQAQKQWLQLRMVFSYLSHLKSSQHV